MILRRRQYLGVAVVLYMFIFVVACSPRIRHIRISCVKGNIETTSAPDHTMWGRIGATFAPDDTMRGGTAAE